MSLIVAISALFSFSISVSSVVFGTTDLMFVFTIRGRSHFPHETCILLLPREVTGGLVNVVRREVVMTGIVLCLWAQQGSPGGWVGGVPPLYHTQLSRQHCLDGCRCVGVSDVNILLRMWSCVTCTQW